MLYNIIYYSIINASFGSRKGVNFDISVRYFLYVTARTQIEPNTVM